MFVKYSLRLHNNSMSVLQLQKNIIGLPTEQQQMQLCAVYRYFISLCQGSL